jgi:hypothetical protein
MSWGILLLPLPADLTSIDGLSADHEPPPVGSRSSVHKALRSAVGKVDLTDPTWGELLGPTWVIELGIGEHDPVESVMLHVRGGEDDVLPVIFHSSRALGCRPFDCSTGELLTDDAQTSWNAFQSFRDRSIAPDSDNGVLSHGVGATVAIPAAATPRAHGRLDGRTTNCVRQTVRDVRSAPSPPPSNPPPRCAAPSTTSSPPRT